MAEAREDGVVRAREGRCACACACACAVCGRGGGRGAGEGGRRGEGVEEVGFAGLVGEARRDGGVGEEDVGGYEGGRGAGGRGGRWGHAVGVFGALEPAVDAGDCVAGFFEAVGVGGAAALFGGVGGGRGGGESGRGRGRGSGGAGGGGRGVVGDEDLAGEGAGVVGVQGGRGEDVEGFRCEELFQDVRGVGREWLKLGTESGGEGEKRGVGVCREGIRSDGRRGGEGGHEPTAMSTCRRM